MLIPIKVNCNTTDGDAFVGKTSGKLPIDEKKNRYNISPYSLTRTKKNQMEIEAMTMTNSVPCGKPDAGKPHVRFDEGEVAPATPRRGSLLYRSERTDRKRRDRRNENRRVTHFIKTVLIWK